MTPLIEPLRLFNEKGTRLLNAPFSKYILEQKPVSVNIEANKGDVVSVTTKGPGSYDIDSFLLTFRFFIQNNERCSFGNISEVYNILEIPLEYKNRYEVARNDLNKYLDSETSTVINGESLTRRKILDVFMYGGYAHATLEKKNLYDEWMKLDVVRDVLHFRFINTLANVLYIIRFVANLNREVIKILESKCHS